MKTQKLGLIDYQKALLFQNQCVSQVAADREQSFLIVCEHPDVITIGRAPGSEQEVLAPSTANIPVVPVTRGGRATLHTPGQVVMYPICDLQSRGRDLHLFMRALEQAIINAVYEFRVPASRVPGKTGVWVRAGTKKIASLGIAAREWVSYHGVAVNVDCDLSKFQQLNPCGFAPEVMTRLDDEITDQFKRVWALKGPKLMHDFTECLAENMVLMLEALKDPARRDEFKHILCGNDAAAFVDRVT